MNPRPARLILAGLLLPLAAAVAGELTCTVTAAKGGDPVIEAAIALVPLDHPAPAPAASEPVEVAQEGQEFFPFVTIVQEGMRVVFPNRDTVQHHVYSLSKAKKFELPLYNPGQKETQIFEASGQVAIGCNIHDWMTAYVVVVPTPWFGKTDAQGRVSLRAPAGRYRLEVWHPRMAKAHTEEITLGDDRVEERSLSFPLKPDRRIRRGGGAGKPGGYR